MDRSPVITVGTPGGAVKPHVVMVLGQGTLTFVVNVTPVVGS